MAVGGYKVDATVLGPFVTAAAGRHETVQDLVLDVVRDAILAGVLAPGAKLRQESLAGVFGTSRIPVREALRALELEGLVVSQPNRGFAVTALDPDDIEEVLDLRVLLEGQAVRLAIDLLSARDLEELERLYAQMCAQGDPDRRDADREAFFTRLYDVSGRRRLAALIARLRHEVDRALHWTSVEPSDDTDAAFYAAVVARDAERATAELAGQYRRVALQIRRHIRDAETPSKGSRRSALTASVSARNRAG